MLPCVLLTLATIWSTTAHMQLYSPPPFKAINNPNTITPDTTLNYPHNCCGETTPMPCRGYLSLLGTSEGASVATWTAGSNQTFSLWGPAPLGGNHYGGSCQVGFSTDKGASFHVVSSYEGNCPLRNGGMEPEDQQFGFTVPKDLPGGEVVFAWTWMNREQEFFMSCAAVTIEGGQASNASSVVDGSVASTGMKRSVGKRDDAVVAFSQRPIMLFADVNNGCLSPKTTAELKYPDPGPVVVQGDGEYPLELPSGTCG
ncbi:hypothetical protein BT63DRAFT_434210 [Microthyrium microscopicum]|uniref:Lytic polysaccharide monooxygenase n=1 Tax=Microthyrium microscopicum TaxID=703497 RepID=A0A6A6U2C8_9PEZI|nr:hypothetical protein BT63DRAFT_434210 [Microthyrium microscopicum]